MNDIDRDESLKKLVTRYNAMAEKYDDIAKTANYSIPKWLDLRLKPLNLRNPRVLDLGCANGFLGNYVKRVFNTCDIYGVDVSPKMISEVKKNGIYRSAVVWDLNKGLPFTDFDSFDLIIAIGFLEFITNPAIIFDGIQNSLKTTGYCLASFECFDKKKHASKIIKDPSVGYPRRLYAPEDIQNLAHRAKLRILSRDRIPAYKSLLTKEGRNYFVVVLKHNAK